MWSGTKVWPKPTCLRHKLVCRSRHYCPQIGAIGSSLVKLPLCREPQFPFEGLSIEEEKVTFEISASSQYQKLTVIEFLPLIL